MTTKPLTFATAEDCLMFTQRALKLDAEDSEFLANAMRCYALQFHLERVDAERKEYQEELEGKRDV